jgi:uncharacterized protein YdaU (DUF1376 family)
MQRMTNEVEGIYRRLLDHSWLEDGLPEDLDEVQPLCKVTSKKKFQQIWMKLDPLFPQGPDGKRRNPRQERERAKQQKNSRVRREAADARWAAERARLHELNRRFAYANRTLLQCLAFALAFASEDQDQKQKDQGALPARARPARMAFSVWNVKGHLYKAAHLAMAQGAPFIDAHGVNPAELLNHLKGIATKLGATWQHTRELSVIVDGAIAQRARQLQTEHGRARLARVDRMAMGGRYR